MPSDNYAHLKTEVREQVAVVTIDREAKRNAMNRDLMQSLTDCFRRMHDDPGVRAVVLTGTGKAFMAGADIEQYCTFDTGEFFAFQEKGRDMYRAVEMCAKPVVAAVNGYALGGGFELALACDMVVASERAKFGLSEVRIGLVPGGGGLQKLARLVGPYAASEIAMNGHFLSAEEGRTLKFVNRVVEHDRLLGEAVELARGIARQAPLAVQVIKKLIRDGRDAGLESAQSLDRAFLANLFRTEDAAEGIAAFVGKRPPQFVGK